MKNILSRFFPIIPAAALLALSVFQPSCANTTQAPTGGLKDTLPPVIRRVVPAPGTAFTHKNGRQCDPKLAPPPAGGGWEVLSMQPI